LAICHLTPSVYRSLLEAQIPSIKNALFKPKNNILSRRKGARSKVKKREEKISEAITHKEEEEDDKPFKDDDHLELPFK
jgi:hypothetical protein